MKKSFNSPSVFDWINQSINAEPKLKGQPVIDDRAWTMQNRISKVCLKAVPKENLEYYKDYLEPVITLSFFDEKAKAFRLTADIVITDFEDYDDFISYIYAVYGQKAFFVSDFKFCNEELADEVLYSAAAFYQIIEDFNYKVRYGA